MKQPIFRVGIITVSIIILSSGIWALISKTNSLYFNAYKRNDEVFKNHTVYDGLLLGSSRTKNTIDPFYLDTTLKQKVFNAGASGANLIEIEMIFNSFLANHSAPKWVLLACDFNLLQVERNIAFPPIYIQYMDKSALLERLLSADGIRTRLLRVFPFFKAIELDDYYKSALIKAFINKTESENGDFYRAGFESNGTGILKEELSDSGNSTQSNVTHASIRMDQTARQALIRIVEQCKRRNIKLIFTYAPEFKQTNEKLVSNIHQVMGFYDSLSNSNGMPFWRHDSLPMCREVKYFPNAGHLNRLGAGVYSQILANQLLNYFRGIQILN